mmetsp:Transcript_118531/g.382653  ORF Transcript_118531/g.382653 Transcript_118531/m.382653 type:complete len:313 (-) Transcript_118531:22-960(-)
MPKPWKTRSAARGVNGAGLVIFSSLISCIADLLRPSLCWYSMDSSLRSCLLSRLLSRPLTAAISRARVDRTWRFETPAGRLPLEYFAAFKSGCQNSMKTAWSLKPAVLKAAAISSDLLSMLAMFTPVKSMASRLSKSSRSLPPSSLRCDIISGTRKLVMEPRISAGTVSSFRSQLMSLRSPSLVAGSRAFSSSVCLMGFGGGAAACLPLFAALVACVRALTMPVMVLRVSLVGKAGSLPGPADCSSRLSLGCKAPRWISTEPSCSTSPSALPASAAQPPKPKLATARPRHLRAVAAGAIAGGKARRRKVPEL